MVSLFIIERQISVYCKRKQNNTNTEKTLKQSDDKIQISVFHVLMNGVTFSQFFSTYRWQHDVVRSNHVTNPRDHNILLLSTICLFIYNHTKEIEFYLFADWLQDLWGRLQFDF